VVAFPLLLDRPASALCGRRFDQSSNSNLMVMVWDSLLWFFWSPEQSCS
jgi:hypothetical protein